MPQSNIQHSMKHILSLSMPILTSISVIGPRMKCTFTTLTQVLPDFIRNIVRNFRIVQSSHKKHEIYIFSKMEKNIFYAQKSIVIFFDSIKNFKLLILRMKRFKILRLFSLYIAYCHHLRLFIFVKFCLMETPFHYFTTFLPLSSIYLNWVNFKLSGFECGLKLKLNNHVLFKHWITKNSNYKTLILRGVKTEVDDKVLTL